MIYIYCSYWGTHTAVIAAAVHLKKITFPTGSTGEAVYDLPLFDRLTPLDQGDLRYYGTDHNGNKVYVIGTRGATRTIARAFRGLLNVFDIKEEIKLIDLEPLSNTCLRLGAYLSRRWGFTLLARPLIIRGANRVFPQVANAVERVKGGKG